MTPDVYRHHRAIAGGLAVWEQGKGSGICSMEWRKANNHDIRESCSKGGKSGGKA